MLLNPLDLLPVEAQDAVVNKKPESYDPGSDGEKADKIELGNPILSPPSNFFKDEGEMSQGFLAISNDLLDHPAVLGMNDKQFRVLISILKLLCYEDCIQDDFGVMVQLKKGEYMFAQRELADRLKVSRGLLERTMARLTSVQIASQRTSHRKTIFTLSERYIIKKAEPRFEPKSSQSRAIKVINKKANKENTHYRSYSQTACELLDFFIDSIKKHKPEITKLPSADQAKHFETLLKDHSSEVIKSVITYAHTDQEFWRDKINTPLNLVKGSKDNPDRMGLLLGRMARDKMASAKPAGAQDRRTKNVDGTPVESPHEGRF